MDEKPTPVTETAATGPRVPRRWIIAAVVAGVLLLAGVAVALVLGDGAQVADESVSTPDLRGMTLERAGAEVKSAGLAPGTVSFAIVDESVTPSGTVLSQDPLPGALVKPGTKLDIVIAQGPQESSSASVETPPATDDSPDTDEDVGDDSPAVTPPTDQPPVMPDLPPAESVDISKLQPRITDPGIFKLVQPEYRTVLEHEGYDANPWQSPALSFGDKPKRVWITADGPYNTPVAVWAWGPSDADWKLKTIWASYPGAFESEDGKGGTWIEPFTVGAGTYTVLVKVNPGVTWWKIRVEEQK